MKKQTFTGYDKAGVIELLDAEIKKEGNQKQFADKHGLHPSQVTDALKGFRLPPAVLTALGLSVTQVYAESAEVATG